MGAVAGELCFTLFVPMGAVVPAMRVLGYSGIAVAVAAFSGPFSLHGASPRGYFTCR